MIAIEMRRLLTISLRQPVEFFLGLLLLSLIFFGARAVAISMFPAAGGGHAASALPLGFLAWAVINNVVSFVHGEVGKDIKSGVFEIIFLRPRLLEKVIVARSLYAVLHSVVVAGGLWLIFSLFSGSVASFLSPALYALVFLAILWGLPMGLLAASLSVITRQSGAMILSLHLIVAALLVVPTFTKQMAGLPFLLPVSSLSVFIASPDAWTFAVSCISCICWMAVAAATWKGAKSFAIRRGSIDPSAYL
jgi:hypothetical protein